MLSVEQEVEGDDTPVLDAVLASDTRREALLAEERELNDKMNRSGAKAVPKGWELQPSPRQ